MELSGLLILGINEKADDSAGFYGRCRYPLNGIGQQECSVPFTLAALINCQSCELGSW